MSQQPARWPSRWLGWLGQWPGLWWSQRDLSWGKRAVLWAARSLSCFKGGQRGDQQEAWRTGTGPQAEWAQDTLAAQVHGFLPWSWLLTHVWFCVGEGGSGGLWWRSVIQPPQEQCPTCQLSFLKLERYFRMRRIGQGWSGFTFPLLKVYYKVMDIWKEMRGTFKNKWILQVKMQGWYTTEK